MGEYLIFVMNAVNAVGVHFLAECNYVYAHGQRKIDARVVFHSCDVLVLLKQHNNGTKEIENPNKGNKASMPENEFDEEEVLSE